MRARAVVLALLLSLGLMVAVPPAAQSTPIAHPSLLFAASDVAGLQSKVTSGQPKLAYELLLRKVDAYMDPTHPQHVDITQTTEWGQNEQGAILADLGFAYQLTGNADYGRFAIDFMLNLAAANWPAWCEAANGCMNPLGNELGRGDLAKGLAVAWDWTYTLMTAGERSTLISSWVSDLPTVDGSGNVLGGTGEGNYLFSCVDEDWALRTSNGNNWHGVCGGGLGMLLLAIEGETGVPSLAPYLAVARARVSNFANFMFGTLGDDAEGILYEAYGLHNAIPFVQAWNRLKPSDPITLPSKLANAPAMLAFEQQPGGGFRFIPRNDSTVSPYLVEELVALNFLIRPDGLSGWLWDHTVGPDGSNFYGTQNPWLSPNTMSSEFGAGFGVQYRNGELLTVLYYQSPAALPRVDPGTVLGRARIYPEFGLVDMRTGFAGGTSDVAATFEAKRLARGHLQYDKGSFTLYGYGARFGIDSGYGCCPTSGLPTNGKSAGHNVMQVGYTSLFLGVDDAQNGGNPYTPAQTIPLAIDAPSMTFIDSDLYTAYGSIVRAGRQFLFARASGEPVVVATADDLLKPSDPNGWSYKWRLHTDQPNAAVAGGSGFTVAAPNGAKMTSAVGSSIPLLAQTAMYYDNYGSYHHPLVESAKLGGGTTNGFDHLAVMALTPAGATAPTVTSQTASGGGVVTVDWSGGRAVYASKPIGGSSVTSAGIVTSNGRFAKATVGKGETVLYSGTSLVLGTTAYVTVTGSAATVVVSGDLIEVKGPAGNLYSVYAPQTINTVKVNGTTVSYTRTGNTVQFS